MRTLTCSSLYHRRRVGKRTAYNALSLAYRHEFGCEFSTALTLPIALCWTADADARPEILIAGLRRGTSPKHRYRPKSLYAFCRIHLAKCTYAPRPISPAVSRLALLTLYAQLAPDEPLRYALLILDRVLVS